MMTDNLYNPEIKRQFIRGECEKHDYSGKEKAYTSIFTKCAEYERELNKDIGDFTGDEFESTYLRKYCATLSARTYKKVLAVVRSYRKWYRQIMNRTAEEEQRAPMTRITAADKNRLFRTEAGFVECIKTVYGSDRYIMLCAIMILYYYGFSKEEISKIKISDIDTNNHSVCGVSINNTTMYDLLLKASSTYEYTCVTSTNVTNPNGRVKHAMTVPYKSTPYLIRSAMVGNTGKVLDNSPVPQRYFQNVLFYKVKAIDELDGVADKYKAYSFRMSAIQRLHWCLIVEQNERIMGLNEALKQLMNDKYNKYSLETMRNDYILWRNTAEDPK